MSFTLWTSEKIEAAKKVLAKHATVADAARELGISTDSLEKGVRRHTGATAYTFLGAKAVKLLSPEEKVRKHELEQKVRFLVDKNKQLEQAQIDAERLKNLIHETKSYDPKPPKWVVSGRAEVGTTGTPILFASDWHWDEVVSAAEMNGINAFNPDIQRRRAHTFFTSAVKLLTVHMAKPSYDKLIVPLGGDMISGSIHEELAETNAAGPSESIVDLADHLIAGFELLLKSFPHIYVPCVVGNHGRLTKKPRFKGRPHDNFEWILYHMVARYFAGREGIHFEISNSMDLPFNVYNTRFLLNHGDQFRGGGGISGFFSPIMRGDAKKRKAAMATHRSYDHLLIGHWHQWQELPGITVNGSLKGFDEYAYGNNFDFQIPIQALFVVHPENGITARWPILLEKPGARFDLRTDQLIDDKKEAA